MLEAGERLILDHLEKKNLLEQKRNDVRCIVRNSILLAIAIVGTFIFVFWAAPPPWIVLDPMLELVIIILWIALWFYFSTYILTTAREIGRLSSGFYRSFSPTELATYQQGFVLSDRRLILKGAEHYRTRVNKLPGDMVRKQRDVISVERAALESIEIEARFYTFKVNFRLKYRWKYAFRNGGQNIHAARFNADQINAMVPGIIVFGKASSPEVPLKHVESGDEGVFLILMVFLFLGVLIMLNLN